MRAKEAETKQVPIWHGSDQCTFWTTLYGVLPVLISVELNHQQWLKKTWVSWVAQWWQHRHRFVFCDSQAISSSQEDHLQHLQQSKPALQFSPTICESHSPAQFRLIIWYHPNSFYSRAMGRRCNVHTCGKLRMIEIDQGPTTDIPNPKSSSYKNNMQSLPLPGLIYLWSQSWRDNPPVLKVWAHGAHVRGTKASMGGPKSWWTWKLISFESWGNQSVELTKQI